MEIEYVFNIKCVEVNIIEYFDLIVFLECFVFLILDILVVKD